ncbi:MAG: hypothetical protein ACYDEY_04700 [Acidimicrobiales bacterium]
MKRFGGSCRFVKNLGKEQRDLAWKYGRHILIHTVSSPTSSTGSRACGRNSSLTAGRQYVTKLVPGPSVPTSDPQWSRSWWQMRWAIRSPKPLGTGCSPRVLRIDSPRLPGRRKLDRQHRAGSPNCFDDGGRHVKGRSQWTKRTKAALDSTQAIAEAHRSMAAARSTSHAKLVNELLAYGVNVRAEALNYAQWQKMFPRSVTDKAVGEAMALLFHKAENAGGKAYHEATRTTALSKTCVCGHREKKPLSQRWHRCPDCGREAQRALFSAFLGLYVHPVTDDNGASKHLLDLEGAVSNFAAFAPHRKEARGMARSSSTKHRGRGRRSRRSTARITARHTRHGRGATEVFGGIPVPDQATTATSVAA